MSLRRPCLLLPELELGPGLQPVLALEPQLLVPALVLVPDRDCRTGPRRRRTDRLNLQELGLGPGLGPGPGQGLRIIHRLPHHRRLRTVPLTPLVPLLGLRLELLQAPHHRRLRTEPQTLR
jgi:hypothetical protein